MPGTNGVAVAEPSGKYIDGVDPDDPEYQRQMMRPAEIKEDVKLMEQRKRVSNILRSEAFRVELEGIISSQMCSGPSPASLLALQKISDILLPQSKYGSTAASGVIKLGSISTIAINDLRGGEVGLYSKSERVLRCKLAAVYRLVDLHGWNTGIYNHITARISRDHEHFLVNPFGMLYREISASSLVKVDIKGEVLDQGTTSLAVDKGGFVIHSAIHSARSDIRCILHVNTPAAVAVSCMKNGLLPLCREAMLLGEIAYYDPNNVSMTPHQQPDEAGDQPADERLAISKAIGSNSKVLFVRNHGFLACGESVEEMWFYASNACVAAESQLRLAPLGLEYLILPSEETRQRVFETAVKKLNEQDHHTKSESGHQWKLGELEFEALMRHLDNEGYRTGYIYHQSCIRAGRAAKRHEDVEIPPTTSSFAYNYDDEGEHAKATQKMLADRQKSLQRSHWLNTPNVYHREDIEEIGTATPKKITHWVPSKNDDVRTSGQATKTTNPNLFAPQGGNPKEFRENQKKVKAKYYFDTNTAGPQSKLLEGVTFDEARKMREEGMAKLHNDQVVVVGAASKGIIQRDHRHNAVVYQSVYSANPFDKITDAELEKYHKDVAKRNNPLSDTEDEDHLIHQMEKVGQSELDSGIDAPRSMSPIVQIQRADSERVPETLAEAQPGTLSATRAETLRSDTSGAEASHDETEKEMPEASPSKDKKKKRKFKMPSFSKKSKDKDKHK